MEDKDFIKKMILTSAIAEANRMPVGTYSGIDLDALCEVIAKFKAVPKADDLMKDNVRLEKRVKELEQINEEHRKLNGELRQKISELEEIEEKYNLLEAYGVDNWYGYEMTMSDYYNNHEDE